MLDVKVVLNIRHWSDFSFFKTLIWVSVFDDDR